MSYGLIIQKGPRSAGGSNPYILDCHDYMGNYYHVESASAGVFSVTSIPALWAAGCRLINGISSTDQSTLLAIAIYACGVGTPSGRHRQVSVEE